MPIFDVFSKRQKRALKQEPDVFQYTDLPRPFRVQVIHILRRKLGQQQRYNQSPYELFKFIHDIIAEELGVLALAKLGIDREYDSALFQFILETQRTENVLDAIEVAFRVLCFAEKNWRIYRNYGEPGAEEVIGDLNARFLEHAIGYQFDGENIVRMDSEFAHAEIVKPVLLLLSDKMYAGANEEFQNAHEHYRHGRYKESLNECSKAFESTMKAICHKRGWRTNKETAAELVATCLSNGLLPDFQESFFSGVRTTLTSGVPTVRNKLSGHGQGPAPTSVPDYMVHYALNMTATAILLLAEAERALGK